jgi:hypothetical protein
VKPLDTEETPRVPKLVIEADYQSLARNLEQQYADSGMREMVGDVPLVGGVSVEMELILRGIQNLIFQFGRAYDLSNDDVLNQLSKFTLYLAFTRLPVAAQSAPILSALLAVRDHYALTGSRPGSVH